MSGTTAPGAVVERSARWILLVPLAAAAFIEVGLVTALFGAIRDGGFDVDGNRTGVVGSTIGFLLLVPLTLMLGIGVVALVIGLFRPGRLTVLDHEGYRVEERGRVVQQIHREQVTGLVFRPGAQATWQGSDADDPSMRGVSRSRLRNRIELRSHLATVELYDGKNWPATVDILRGWVRDRPELVDDPDSVSFLRPAADPVPAPPTHESTDAPQRLPASGFGLVALAIRRRDPWAPFLPDAYGQYSSMFNGRYTLPRAPRRGSTLGLAMRWLFLVCWLAPFGFLAYFAIWIAWMLIR
jgi:hypothetical protein